MRIAPILGALLLAGCSTPQPPNPIAPIARVDLKPVRDRGTAIKAGNEAIGTKLEETRIALDAAIQEGTALTIDKDQLQKDLTAASNSLKAAALEQKAQSDRANGLLIDIDAAQEKEDAANLKANAAVERANTAEGKVYKYELQEKEDHGPWWAPGLNGIWRNFKFLGWHVIILLVILAALGFLLNMFVPLARPILNTMAMFFVGLGKTIWGLISRLWQRKNPP